MQTGKTNISILSFFLPSIKPYKWWYVLMMQAPIIGAFYNVANMYSLKLVVDAFAASDIPQYATLLKPIAMYIGAILVLELVWRISQFSWMKTQPFVRADITVRAYDYIQYHSHSFFQNTHSGSITSKVKGIVSGYNDMWFTLHHRLTNPLLSVAIGIVSLLFINLNLFLFILAWSCVFFPVMLKMSFKIGKLARSTNDSQHEIIGLIADNVSNIFSILSFASRNREFAKINDFAKKEVAKNDYNQNYAELKNNIIGGFLYMTMLFFAFIYMIHLRRINAVTTGDFVFVMTSMYFVIDNIWTLVIEIREFTSKLGDLKSSFSIISIPQHQIYDTAFNSSNQLQVTKGEIEFKNLCFDYDGDGSGVIKNLNLTIKAGEKIGIVGHSGAGKSTLISLLLKNFKVTSGEILIDGQSIYRVSSDSLRSQIALIPQDTALFHRSIGDNIGYAKDNPSKDEIILAAKMANIHDFIDSLPNKYETLVGERGVKLSGGQRQRIAIARAILKNAPILILDEATSSLDSQTENQIQQALSNLIDAKSKTVIAIAHRLSTLKYLDRIIVLENGTIVEQGKHDDLIQTEKSLYKKLWDMQAI
jgi:ATP-binding cassette subfamily B protein